MKKNKGLWMVILVISITILSYVGLLFFALPKWNLWFILFIFLQVFGFLCAIPIAIIIHELGHCVFGLKNGYQLVSFKFLFWEVVSDDEGHYKIHKSPLQAGLLGQCLMTPPKPVKKKAVRIKRFNLYNAGGLVFSYLLILFFLLLYLIPCLPLRWFILPNILVGVFLALNNSVVVPNGINDVCNYLIVKKNPRYLDSICYQLEVVGNLYKGKRAGAKTLYEPYYEDKLNHISLAAVQFKFYYYVDHQDLEQAKVLIDLVNRNYYNILFPVQRLAVSFDIFWADLVINHNFKDLRRHFNRLTNLEKRYLLVNSELNTYYQIYEKILNNDYNIEGLIKEIFDEAEETGELLSLRARFDLLEAALVKEEEV